MVLRLQLLVHECMICSSPGMALLQDAIQLTL
jgi:hypothetical protein